MSREPLVRRAIAALRSGRAVAIGNRACFLSVEAPEESLALLDPDGKAPLILSGRRAAALAMANLRDSADPARPVLIQRQSWMDSACAVDLADPGRDFARAPLGPLVPLPLGDAECDARAALALARSAGLLPAGWLLPPDVVSAVEIDAAASRIAPTMTEIARARLPVDGIEAAQVVAFRASDDGQDHVALIVGAFGGQPPLVRLHSECLTGDVFGSLKCDCGPQLREALRLIGAAGGGILLYLRQEGRGIGLANKLRAYALQDRGLDTVEANLRIGFADDERDYRHAAAILDALGVESVRLLTNNPAKVKGLEAAGIKVAERVAHHMPANPHNADYLSVKRERSGHLP